MYLIKTPNIVQRVYKSYTWRIENCKNKVFLSFDDGPHPESTPLILDILDEYNAKACFFCLGKNVKEHRSLFHEILARGHSIGNHGYSHVSGWTSENDRYIEDIELGATYTQSIMFRPPYGRIRPSQASYLMKLYKLVMWDIMSGDFDPSLSAESCFDNVAKKVKNGSIIVMHDNKKALPKIPILLPMLLDYFPELGLTSEAITPELLY